VGNITPTNNQLSSLLPAGYAAGPFYTKHTEMDFITSKSKAAPGLFAMEAAFRS
jgi:hypothetical protein